VARPQLTIAKSRHLEPGLDQPQLQAAGLEHIRRLASANWTDHNVHDPGITTLELLSYAVTDLTYRASLPIEEVLAKQELPTARMILPSRPLTLLDYRKMIMDIHGVKNAWIVPAPIQYYADTTTGEVLRTHPRRRHGITPIAVRGVYDVLIQYTPDKKTSTQKAHVRSNVLTALHAKRNLCEDFDRVHSVESQSFLLCAEIDLTPDADTTFVHAEILRLVQDYLAPGVNRYTRDEMLARRKPDGSLYTPADLFDGPQLFHGFVDSAELAAAELRTELRLSDIISIVMDIPGVRAVREVLISPELPGAVTPAVTRWVVPVSSGKQATLNSAKSRLVYYKRNMPIVPAPLPEPPMMLPRELSPEDIPVPLGSPRNLRAYESVQHHFPAIYGVGENPLPESATQRRKALAAQLKAYLLFFDQIMANYCAQLADLWKLFSIDPAVTTTYATQIVSREPEYLAIYGVTEANADALDTTLGGLAEDASTRTDRRTRFLNHLIARVAERFQDFSAIMQSAFGATDASLLSDRLKFLRGYSAISKHRSAAANYRLKGSQDVWNSANTSGLEQRLARLLGIGNSTRRDLTDVTLAADAQVTGDAVSQFGFTVTNKATGETFVTDAAKTATADLAGSQLRRALELGQWNSTYVRAQTTGQKQVFTIVAKTGEVVAQSPEFDTAARMESAIVGFRSYLRQHYSREGFFVVENLLLRPRRTGERTLRFCVDPECADCAGDPLSFQLHVVLPAYAGRFNNMEFRRFVEEVIREEVPAHILAKICWVDEAQMAGFQTAYREWYEVLSRVTLKDRAKRINAFVDVLSAIKSVYPAEKLTDCSAPETQPKFILGRSALGSKTEND
jgi:hypothetical protein